MERVVPVKQCGFGKHAKGVLSCGHFVGVKGTDLAPVDGVVVSLAGP